jgi:CubicO group peptidase (beta-lactamase class C family)
MKTKKIILSHIFLFVIVNATFSQSLGDGVIKRIDQLFGNWNRSDGPGCAIGIVRNDSILYSKGYGMANVETGLKNTSETIYQTASISKQFTAYSIVLLVKAGKLNLDDDIHKYISWFPDLKETITIRNLLNHTSGIREDQELLGIAGTRWDDVITQEHILKVLQNQQALNFKPNNQYSYSNSNYILLAEIIKSVTNQSLRRFTDSALFIPLGMQHTFFCDDYMEIVKNRASGYWLNDNKSLKNLNISRSTVGSANLFTCVDDMSKWIVNFYNTKVGNSKDIDLLTKSLAKFSNNEHSSYAFGMFNYKYHGLQIYEHPGKLGGFSGQIIIFPELKMGFIILSNLRDFPFKEKAFELADLFINETNKQKKEPEAEKMDSSGTILTNPQDYLKYSGNYMNDHGIVYKIHIRNNKMYLNFYDETYLLKVKNQTAIPITESDHKFIFDIKKNGDTLLNQQWPGGERTLKKCKGIETYSAEELQNYVGTYYSPELDCRYKITLRNHELVMTHSKYENNKLELMGSEDLFSQDYWWLPHLKVTRNKNNQIDGFEVNSDRIMHLKFIKEN